MIVKRQIWRPSEQEKAQNAMVRRMRANDRRKAKRRAEFERKAAYNAASAFLRNP